MSVYTDRIAISTDCYIPRAVVGESVPKRRKYEERVLAAYHGTLVKAGVDNYPFEACLRDVRMGSLFRFSQVVSLALIDRPGQRRERMFEAQLERCHAMLEDHNILNLSL